ncbi:sn-glycerol-3-phosphate ABC transporter ATP-binding protein UgpC [Pilimelia columellifera]|uniref:Sn-glycerol-3-phosphate ABC transporter ATP-binding protein UgpC n=1 Tax=Pilimelia columellifera subsp. columellifera TaxID=706583 RepID=A0ABN3N1K7_9ACTN
MADIVLRKVSKMFGDGTAVVRDVDLEIADGEFVILVGPSGCGKSTTLNMVAGLDDITSGDLLIGGERVNERAPRERDIAMVFQSYALYPHLTVAENIAFPLRLARLDKPSVAARVAEVAALLELESLLDRRPANLSGGQRQRVAMGRAIVRRPRAFLMDEPLSNLDAKLRVQMRAVVSRLQRRLGTTTVYVTHDQVEAMTLGDRVVVMRSGAVQQVAAPRELYERPVNLFVAGFIGSPAMNFLPGMAEEGRVRCPLGDLPMSAPLARDWDAAGRPARVVVGLRPEHFEDSRLVDDTARAPGAKFEAEAEMVESLGSDTYVHVGVEGDRVESAELAELNAEIGGAALDSNRNRLVTRLGGQSAARVGDRLRIWVDASRLYLFHPDTGARLGA